jgi:hypothetical protein
VLSNYKARKNGEYGMTPKEIVAALVAGNKARRPNWVTDFIYMDEDGIIKWAPGHTYDGDFEGMEIIRSPMTYTWQGTFDEMGIFEISHWHMANMRKVFSLGSAWSNRKCKITVEEIV